LLELYYSRDFERASTAKTGRSVPTTVWPMAGKPGAFSPPGHTGDPAPTPPGRAKSLGAVRILRRPLSGNLVSLKSNEDGHRLPGRRLRRNFTPKKSQIILTTEPYRRE